MSVYLTGADATRLIRASRIGAAPELVRPCYAILTPDPRRDLASHEVRDYLMRQLHHLPDQPLTVRVPAPASRARISDIESKVTAAVLPSDLFRVLDLNPFVVEASHIQLPELYVDSPLMDLLMLADTLDEHVVAGSVERRQADILLIDRACEYCGTYSLDPFAPNKREATYDVKPVLKTKELRAYLAQPHREYHHGGMRRLRVAAKYAYDRCASPSETLAVMALTAMPRLGGFHLPNMNVNKPLDLDSYGVEGLYHQQLTPDIHFPDIDFVIEVQGAVHKEARTAAEDRRRAHDYQLLGIEALFCEASEYATPSGIRGLALEIAARIDQANNNDNQLTRVRRLIKDKRFLVCQQLLFETLFTLRR